MAEILPFEPRKMIDPSGPECDFVVGDLAEVALDFGEQAGVAL
jgi:hypothetical protein